MSTDFVEESFAGGKLHISLGKFSSDSPCVDVAELPRWSPDSFEAAKAAKVSTLPLCDVLGDSLEEKLDNAFRLLVVAEEFFR